MLNQRKHHTSKAPLWSPTFLILIFVSLVSCIVMQILMTVTPLYVVSLGGSVTYSGVLVVLFCGTAAISRIICGGLVDRCGRWIILVISILIIMSATLTPCFISGLALLAVYRIVQGFGMSAMQISAGTAVADILPPERVGEGVGYYSLGQSLATAVGPGIGLALIADGNFSRMFASAFGLCLVALMLMPALRYENRPAYREKLRMAQEQNIRDRTHTIADIIEKKAFFPAGIMLLLYCGASACINYLPLYTESTGMGGAGLFFTVAAVMMVISRLLLSNLMDKLAPIYLETPALLAGIFCYILLAYGQTPVTLYIAAACYGFCQGLLIAVLNGLAIKLTPQSRWGAANATFFLGSDIGLCIGGLLWGILVDLSANYAIVFMGAAIFLTLALVLCFISKSNRCPVRR